MNFTFGDSHKNLQEKPKFRVAKKSKKDSRKFESSPKYCAGVLVGNWFDRRSEYTSPFNEWQTTYKSLYKSYDPKFLNNDRSVAWDRKLEDEVGKLDNNIQDVSELNVHFLHVNSLRKIESKILIPKICQMHI